MEDEKIIDLYWNRDQGAIGHTAEKYGSYCGRRGTLCRTRDRQFYLRF